MINSPTQEEQVVNNTNTPFTPSNTPSNFKSRLFKITGLVFLAALAIFGGLYFYGSYQNQNAPKNTAQDYTYTYQRLVTYKLTGLQPGRGAQFDMPVEFNADAISAPKTQQAQFGQYPIKGQRTATIAQIAVAALPAKTPLTKTYLNSLAQSIVNPKAKDYALYTDSLKEFISQRVATGYNISLSKPNSLNTPYLKNNAWSANFSAVPKIGSSSATLPDFSGQVLMAIGKDTFYYFLIGAVDYNWRGNQIVWKGVTDSLKIDQ